MAVKRIFISYAAPDLCTHELRRVDAVIGVVFSPDGRILASGSGDRTVWLWETNVDRAIQRVCATTRDTLTPATWKQYLPDLPDHPPCP